MGAVLDGAVSTGKAAWDGVGGTASAVRDVIV